MKIYENSYFHLRVEFPDNWGLNSWQHSKIVPTWQSLYQIKDDDVPVGGTSASKFLFTAILHSAESEALIEANVELSVSRLSPSKDMRTSLVENFMRERGYYQSNGIETSIVKEGAWTIDGNEFTFVDQVSRSRKGVSEYRFFFRPHREAMWLYGKIAGYKRKAYEEALEIVQGMKVTAP